MSTLFGKRSLYNLSVELPLKSVLFHASGSLCNGACRPPVNYVTAREHHTKYRINMRTKIYMRERGEYSACGGMQLGSLRPPMANETLYYSIWTPKGIHIDCDTKLRHTTETKPWVPS